MQRTKVAENLWSYDTRQGRRYIAVFTLKGEQMSRAAPEGCTLREAKAFRDETRRELARGARRGVTVAEAVTAWQKDGKVAGLAAATLLSRKDSLAIVVQRHGKEPLTNLTAEDYERARDSMLEGTWQPSAEPAARSTKGHARRRRGRASGADGSTRPLLPGTVRLRMSKWRAFEAWAVARKLIPESRMAAVTPPKASQSIARALSLDALQAFLATCDSKLEGEHGEQVHGHGTRRSGVVEGSGGVRTPEGRQTVGSDAPRAGSPLLADHGLLARTQGDALSNETPFAALLAVLALVPLRMSELRGMQWRDLDLTAGTFKLVRSMAPATNAIKTEKDGKLHPRTVPIAACVPYLRAMRAWQVAQGLPDVDPQGWVWSDERGKPLPYSTVRYKKEQYLAEAGLPHVRLHDLRHTGISRRLDAGISVQDVQAMSGHRQVSTLLGIYAHAELVHVAAAEDAFAAQLRTERKENVG